MSKSKREKTTAPSLNVSPRAISRRSMLTGAITAGAVGTAVLGAPSTVHARRNRLKDPALFNPMKNRGLRAKGDGITDDHAAVQQTIDRALASLVQEPTPGDVDWDFREATVDLQGRTYLLGSSGSATSGPLKISLVLPSHTADIKTRLRIINGTLLFNLHYVQPTSTTTTTTLPSSGSGFTPTAIQIYADEPSTDYPEVTFEHVRVQNVQTHGFDGVKVERGLRCSFFNCAIEERNTDNGSVGFARNLILRGCQMCTFIDSHFGGGDTHVVFEQLPSSGLPNTDCRFYGCTFSESNGPAIVSTGVLNPGDGVTAAQCLFDGCSIETAGGGNESLVSLYDTRNMKFRACRFENGTIIAPLVVLGKANEESTDARFIDCNFSGDKYDEGYCITGDADVTGTAVIASVFPVPPDPEFYAPVSIPSGFTAVANTNLADQDIVNTEDADTAYTIDWTRKVHHLTMVASCEFYFSNNADGASITVLLEDDVSGPHEPDWPSEVLWEGGSAPVLSGVTPTSHVYTFTQIGGNVYGVGRVDIS